MGKHVLAGTFWKYYLFADLAESPVPFTVLLLLLPLYKGEGKWFLN